MNEGCMDSARRQLIAIALRRGLRKRCPHCGQGPLFAGWHHLERCSVCGKPMMVGQEGTHLSCPAGGEDGPI